VQTCKLRLGDPADAIRSTEYVLSEQPDHVKALYKRGQARLANMELDEALQDLTKAAELAPADGEALLHLQRFCFFPRRVLALISCSSPKASTQLCMACTKG
jgi:tetratricopeptide (TPR) repeat protein